MASSILGSETIMHGLIHGNTSGAKNMEIRKVQLNVQQLTDSQKDLIIKGGLVFTSVGFPYGSFGPGMDYTHINTPSVIIDLVLKVR